MATEIEKNRVFSANETLRGEAIDSQLDNCANELKCQDNNQEDFFFDKTNEKADLSIVNDPTERETRGVYARLMDSKIEVQRQMMERLRERAERLEKSIEKCKRFAQAQTSKCEMSLKRMEALHEFVSTTVIDRIGPIDHNVNHCVNGDEWTDLTAPGHRIQVLKNELENVRTQTELENREMKMLTSRIKRMDPSRIVRLEKTALEQEKRRERAILTLKQLKERSRKLDAVTGRRREESTIHQTKSIENLRQEFDSLTIRKNTLKSEVELLSSKLERGAERLNRTRERRNVLLKMSIQ